MVIKIENFRYTESTAFDERVLLAGKLNEIVDALNAWGDVPIDIEIRMQSLEAKEGKQNQDIATANTQSSQALREATSAKSIANTAKSTADIAKSTADSTIAKSDTAIEDSSRARVDASNALGIAQESDATSAEAMTEASKALAKTVTLDGKTDATNVRVGALEQSEGQQEAKITTLQRDLNNVKAEYLDKYDLEGTQLIRSKTDFETEPLIRTVSPGDVEKDNGRHAVNYATMKRDAVMLEGAQTINGIKEYPPGESNGGNRTELINWFGALKSVMNSVPAYMFMENANAKMPAHASVIGQSAYQSATLENPVVNIDGFLIGDRAFQGVVNMTALKCSASTSGFDYLAVSGCPNLESVDINRLDSLWRSVFNGDPKLDKFIIRNGRLDGAIPGMRGPSFNDTPIASGTGYIYVPDELVEQYRTATNWVIYANQIKGLSELPAEVSA